MAKNYLYILVLCFVFCFNTFIEAETGLVGWWKFDEGTGDILHDSSGKNNHGDIRGAKWVKGKTGIALLFDGEDDHVICGNDVSLQLEGPLTISTWVKVSSGTVNRWYIVSKCSWNLGFMHGVLKQEDPPVREPALRITFYVRLADGPPHNFDAIYLDDSKPETERIPINKWVYIAVTADVENKKIEFYVNGKLATFNWWLDNTIRETDKFSVQFGREAGTNSLYFTGFMNETKIYNRALLAEEIEKNYESELKTKDETIRVSQ